MAVNICNDCNEMKNCTMVDKRPLCSSCLTFRMTDEKIRKLLNRKKKKCDSRVPK